MPSISGLAANYFQLIPDPCANGFIQQLTLEGKILCLYQYLLCMVDF